MLKKLQLLSKLERQIIYLQITKRVCIENNIEWEAQAFGEERYFSEIKFGYKVSNINRKKDFFFKVRVYFSISEDIRNLIDEKKFLSVYEVRLE